MKAVAPSRPAATLIGLGQAGTAGSSRIARAGLDSSIQTTLFRIACLLHGALSRGLAVFEGLLDRHLASQNPGNVLAHNRAQCLKLRDAHKLDSGIGHWLNAGVSRIGCLHGV